MTKYERSGAAITALIGRARETNLVASSLLQLVREHREHCPGESCQVSSEPVAVSRYNCDVRPLIIRPGEFPERVGPDPVPLELREWLTNETATLALLRHEYAVARQAHHDRR